MERTDLKFALFPADTEDTASSRIRVYTLARALSKQGISVTFGYSPYANIFFVQKKVTRETLKVVRQARAKGCTIMYDVDDLGDALWYWVRRPYFAEMVHLADTLTTDTTSHSIQLSEKYGAKCVEVIPDAIDYYPIAPVQLPLATTKPLRVLWFGSSSNIALYERYVNILTALSDVEVVVATNASSIEMYSAKYPAVKFVPWSRSGFISILQSCHLSCLMHDGAAIDQAKSNNKMITSITWGVPSVVSRTAEYERTAKEAGVEYALFANETELPTAVENLRSPEARQNYLSVAQPEIWRRYSPDAVAERFLEVVAKYIHLTTQKVQPNWRPSEIHIGDPVFPKWRAHVLNLVSSKSLRRIKRNLLRRNSNDT